MFNRIRNYIKNKGLCYTAASKSGKVELSICSDLNAARVTTPYSNSVVDLDDVVSALTEAYRAAQDASDDRVAEEVHSIRHTIVGVYA